MAWEVSDIESVVAALRARGVVFEEYDLSGLKTVNGIANIQGNYPRKGIGERAAWFKDSEGNLLGLSQPIRRADQVSGAESMLDVVLKRFDDPDEVRTFEKGKFEIVRIGGLTVGRATYQPGWRWSVDVGPRVGASRCNVEHVCLVLAGCSAAAIEGGAVHEFPAGALFYIPPGPPGHDSWVVGDETYVSLHFLGTEDYATK
jgi:hypothetical protein